MSNQAAVHKALMLVVDEISQRYGAEGTGLVAGFLTVVNNMSDGTGSMSSKGENAPRPFHRTDPVAEEKKVDYNPTTPLPARSTSRKQDSRQAKSGLVSFEDMLRTSDMGRVSPLPSDQPGILNLAQNVDSSSNRAVARSKATNGKSIGQSSASFVETEESRLIEVKPLPKIRLSLMPSPREEDEDDYSSASPMPSSQVRRKKKKSPNFQSSSKTSSDRLR
jgi:hypothetical protein